MPHTGGGALYIGRRYGVVPVCFNWTELCKWGFFISFYFGNALQGTRFCWHSAQLSYRNTICTNTERLVFFRRVSDRMLQKHGLT